MLEVPNAETPQNVHTPLLTESYSFGWESLTQYLTKR